MPSFSNSVDKLLSGLSLSGSTSHDITPIIVFTLLRESSGISVVHLVSSSFIVAINFALNEVWRLSFLA